MPIDYIEFAKKIKNKYPQYKNVDDLILAQKMVEKYPEYKNEVSFQTSKKKEPTVSPSKPKKEKSSLDIFDKMAEKPSASSGSKSDGDIYSLPQNPGVLYQKRGNDWYKKVGTKFLPLTQGNVQERYDVLNANAEKMSQFDLDRMEQTPVSIDPKTIYKEDPEDLKKQFENTYKNIKETEKLEQLKRQEQIKKSYPKEEEKLNWRLGAGKIYDFDSEDEIEEYKNISPAYYMSYFDINGNPLSIMDPEKSKIAQEKMKQDFGETEFKAYSSIAKMPSLNELKKVGVDNALNKKFSGTNLIFKQDGDELIVTSKIGDGINETILNQAKFNIGDPSSDKRLKSFLASNIVKKSEREKFENAELIEDIVDLIGSKPYKFSAKLVEDMDVDGYFEKQKNIIDEELKSVNSESFEKDLSLYEESVKKFNQDVKNGMSDDEFNTRSKELQDAKKQLSYRQEVIKGTFDRAEKLDKISQNFDKAGKIYDKKLENEGSFVGLVTRGFGKGLVNTSKAGIDFFAAAVAPMVDAKSYADFVYGEGKYEQLKSMGLDDDEIKNEVQKDIKKTSNKIFANVVDVYGMGTTEQYEKSSKRGAIDQAAFALAESFGTMLGGVGAAPSQVGIKAGFFAMSYNAMEDQMRGAHFDNLSENEKKLISVPYGIVIGALEHLGMKTAATIGKNKIVNQFSDFIIHKTFSELPKDASILQIRSAIDKNIAASVAKGMIKITSAGAVEGGTEFTQQIFEGIEKDVANRIIQSNQMADANDEYNGKVPKEIIDKIQKNKFFEDAPDITSYEGIKSLLDQSVNAFAVGAIAGAMGGTIGVSANAVSNKVSNNRFAVYRDVVLNDGARNGLISDIEEKVKTNEISREEADTRIGEINKSYSTLMSIPSDLSVGAQREAFALINERDKLTAEIEGKDPNLVSAQKNRITEINNTLTNISENATKESTEQQQEVTAEGGGVQREGVIEGQPEVGQTEGPVGQTEEQGADLGNRPIESRGVEEEITIEKPVIAQNTIQEVERVKSVAPETEDGSTFNLDGTKYEGTGLVVPVVSENTTVEEVTPEMIADFVEKHQDKIGDNETVKVGIYKFPNSNKVSIDLNVVAPESAREQAIEFGKRADQESLFDLGTYENVKTGGTGQNPTVFTGEQFKEIAKAFKEGRVPNVFEEVVSPEQEAEQIGLLMAGTDAETDQKAATITNKAISKSVSKAAKAVSKILPKVKFIVHDNDDSYRKATGEEGRSQSSRGEYNPQTKTIHINASKANKRTIAHEVFHAILLDRVSSDKEAAAVTKRMIDAISSKLEANSELKKYLDDFASNYEENIQNEEKLAELVGKLAEDYQNQPQTVKDVIKRWINKIAQMFGLSPVTSDTEVIDLLDTIARKVAAGNKIKESDISKVIPSATDKYGNLKKPSESSIKNLKNRKQKIVDEAKSNVVKGKTVSTRLPKKNDVHSRRDYIVSMKSLEADAVNDKKIQEQYIKIAKEISSYNISKIKNVENFDDAKKVVNDFKNSVKSNLKWLHDSFGNDVRDISKLWYDGANIICNNIASKYNYSLEQVSGVMAVLSPQMDWFRNLSLGERVIDIYTKQQDSIFDSKMIDYVNNATSGTRKNKVPLFKDAKEISLRVKGKKLSELNNKDKSYFIRVFDEVYNSREYNNISPNGEINGLVRKSDGSPGACGWGAFPTIEKSISILQDGSIENISSNLGNMHKVRNFFNNISNPNDLDAVTIDTHAVAAGLLLPLSGSSKQALYNFGGAGNVNTGMTGTYPVYADAYRELANELGLLPREVQSITWEAVRGLFKATFKLDKNNEVKINKVWDDYSSGLISLDQAHSKVENIAGGINKPVWFEYIADGNEKSMDKNSAAVDQSNLDDESNQININQQKISPRKQLASEPVAGNKLFNEPLKDATTIAERYAKKSGIEMQEVTPIRSLDKENSIAIAKEFDKMKNDPTDPEVAKAYQAMADETLAQYEEILKDGYVIEINNEEPYSSSGDMINDLRENKRMKIFSTESGFGDEPITDQQRKENPLLRDSGFKDVNGETLLVNDVFRFVHDFFGHAKMGNSFGPVGEENAWLIHSVMYSPLARRAMTSETRGQNSWVNFSGVNDDAFKLRDKARKLRKEGKIDEANELVGQVYDMMSFAEQKVGIMPEWVSNTNISTRKQLSDLLDRKQRKSASSIVSIARQNGFSDDGIMEYLRREGFSDQEIASAMSVNNNIDIDQIFDRSKKALRDKQRKNSFVKALRFIWNKFIDRQSDIKRLITGIKTAPSAKAFNMLVTRAGAKGFANLRYKRAEELIYKGLKEKDIDILDKIIYLRRMIAVNQNRAERGLNPYKGIDGFSEAEARRDLDNIKNQLGDNKFNDLMTRANEYFDVFAKSLESLYNSGRITEEVYNNLKDIEYSPIATIKYIIGDDLSLDEIDRQAEVYGVTRKDIATLTDKNENEIIMDSKWLLMMNLMSVEGRAWENRMLNSFADAIESAKDDQKQVLSEYVIIPKGDQKVPAGFITVNYFKDGVAKKIFVKAEYAVQLLDIKNKQSGLETLGKLTGTRILRFFATGGNPLFIVGNTAVDFANITFFSDVYSKNKLVAIPKLTIDFVSNFIRKISNTKKYKSLTKEFLEHGGGMDFMSSDGLRALKGLKPGYKITSLAQSILVKYGNAMSYLGETSEFAFRVAVYEKTKENLIKNYKKENNGSDPKGEDLENIMFEAARESRETVDFSQGGSWAKSIDTVMPYLNASLQGFRRPIDYAKKDPVGFSSSLVQASIMSGSIAGLSIASIMTAVEGDDDDDKKAKAIDALNSISEYEKANYHIIFTGEKNKDGEYKYVRIKKLPVLSMVSTLTEQMVYKYLLSTKDRPYAFDNATMNMTIEKSIPFTPSDIMSRNPLISGILTYHFNEDTFTGEEVFRQPKGKKIAPTVEGIYDDKVDAFYKEIAPSLGLSPIRSKAFIEKIVTSENTNPTIAIFNSALSGIFDKDTGPGKEFSDAMKKVFESAGKKLVRYTNKDIIMYAEMDKAEAKEMQIETDIYKKEQKMYNEIKSIYKDGKTLTNEEVINMVKDNFEPRDVKKYVGKYVTYIRNMNVDRSILDILYEDTPEVQALKLYNKYGSTLDNEERDEIISVIRTSHKKISPKAFDIYNKKYKKGL